MQPSFSLGLIGFPLDHSLSPRLHNAALQALAFSGKYCLYPIPPLPGGVKQLEGLLRLFSAGELQGLNVTIPHKQAVIPFVTELAPTALATGAVNTIYLKDGKLMGENTDVAGFLADLHRLLPGEAQEVRQALVLGAGGAARGVVYALVSTSWQVHVAARRLLAAQEIANGQSLLLEEQALSDLISCHQLSLVVNATPFGMGESKSQSPWPSDLAFPNGVVVYDLVYNPAETLFLKSARLSGLVARNGLGMLVEQAAFSFEIWTGQKPSLQAMWQSIQ